MDNNTNNKINNIDDYASILQSINDLVVSMAQDNELALSHISLKTKADRLIFFSIVTVARCIDKKVIINGNVFWKICFWLKHRKWLRGNYLDKNLVWTKNSKTVIYHNIVVRLLTQEAEKLKDRTDFTLDDIYDDWNL